MFFLHGFMLHCLALACPATTCSCKPILWLFWLICVTAFSLCILPNLLISGGGSCGIKKSANGFIKFFKICLKSCLFSIWLQSTEMLLLWSRQQMPGALSSGMTEDCFSTNDFAFSLCCLSSAVHSCVLQHQLD